jgi:hypothetical protein
LAPQGHLAPREKICGSNFFHFASRTPERPNFPPKKFLHYENFFNIEEINLGGFVQSAMVQIQMCWVLSLRTRARLMKRGEQ